LLKNDFLEFPKCAEISGSFNWRESSQIEYFHHGAGENIFKEFTG